jgi:integrase
VSKRAKGEGSVRQRKDGRGWEARLTYEDAITGETRTISLYGPTATVVRAKLDKARDRIKAQLPAKDSALRVCDWIEQWWETGLAASDRADSTKELYADLSRIHICGNPIGKVPLDRLRKSHIDGLIVGLKKAGYAESTIRSIYTVLRGALDDAKVNGLIATNPTHLVPRPAVTNKEAHHLPPGQVAVVLGAVRDMDSRHLLPLVLIAATGMRRGEGVGVQWDAINLDKGGMRVLTQAVRTRAKGLHIKPVPKTERSKRPIPLSADVVALLKAHRAAQAAERLRAGEAWTDHGLVFTTETGGILEPRNVLRTIVAAAKKAGVEDCVVHTLRHSAATAWLEDGRHIRAVADLLGHSSIAITGDLYGHTEDGTTRGAIDGLSEALGISGFAV